jgi:NAD(P)-dependent dehydrogenase (short-subunit alcohol dehydrogenase family)
LSEASRLEGKYVLVTGGARRVGRVLALAAARKGAKLLLHHANSPVEAEQVRAEIEAGGGEAHVLQADFSNPEQAGGLISRAQEFGTLYALVNNAAIFEHLNWKDTSLEDWQRNMNINLTAPFLLSQAFARSLPANQEGRIVNILDWRALRPGPDHFPYTISKAGLAALTRSLGAALAPQVTVNGLALGAILPPSTGEAAEDLLENVPAGRWAKMNEVEEAFLFLLEGPGYITGEILHLDGGRHLV